VVAELLGWSLKSLKSLKTEITESLAGLEILHFKSSLIIGA
jgi:hypothetical protein